MIASATKTTSLRRCRGLAIVEFVVVLPLCLMLLLAVGEFGRAFLQYNTLTKAVRDGARYAAQYAIDGSTGVMEVDSALIQETQNLVVHQNIAGTGGSVLPGFTTADVSVASVGTDMVMVSASYTYDPIFAFVPTFGYAGSVTASGAVFQAAVTMRAL